MGFFARLFKSNPQSVYDTCIKLYRKAKTMRPGKPERDYLKIVLLTKPPFDYQNDMVIDGILDDNATIEELATLIARFADRPNRDLFKKAFQSREWNLRNHPWLKERNREFFEEFWS